MEAVRLSRVRPRAFRVRLIAGFKPNAGAAQDRTQLTVQTVNYRQEVAPISVALRDAMVSGGDTGATTDSTRNIAILGRNACRYTHSYSLRGHGQWLGWDRSCVTGMAFGTMRAVSTCVSVGWALSSGVVGSVYSIRQ